MNQEGGEKMEKKAKKKRKQPTRAILPVNSLVIIIIIIINILPSFGCAFLGVPLCYFIFRLGWCVGG
jgi:hypothetical protein